MNSQFPNAQIYPQGYQSSQQPSPQSSRPPTNGLTHPISHHIPQTSQHPLPPLNIGSHAFSAAGESYGSRSQTLPSSLMTSHADSIAQTFAPYAPTATTYYNSPTSYAPPSQAQQPLQKSRPSSTSALSMSQPQPLYTSAPSQCRLADLAPAPPRDGKPSLTLGNTGNAVKLEDDSQPTHVVGSQGRRGILPSAPGRPAAATDGNTTGQKGAPTPAKDSEGKFPCPHCQKNYLHAKHLKRHLLRHTGVRPYTCGLCKDTFSRSDILKRHFQKCSQRRGNPTGESHLSHSRANRKSRAQEEAAARMESTTPTMADQPQQMPPYTPTSIEGNFDISSLNLNQHQYGDSSNQASRSNSVKKSKGSTGSASNRASLGMVNTSGYNSNNYEYSTGHITPDSVTSSGAATPYTYPHEARGHQLSPNGMTDIGFPPGSRPPVSSSYVNGPLPRILGQTHGHAPDLDWNSLPYNSSDEYGPTQYYSGTNTPLQRTKSDTDFTALHYGEYPHSIIHNSSKA